MTGIYRKRLLVNRVNLTMSIAQHLSGTGNLIQIYTDPALFDSRVAEAVSAPQ